MSSARPTENQPSSPDSRWLCFTCREGLRVARRRIGADGSLEDVGQGCFLPDASITDDEILEEPALAPTLSDAEVCELTSAHHQIAVAATFLGPPQDKTQNQDFSLTAVIRGPHDEPWVFATVADGVSTKTFWPARAARISALTAFQTIRQAIRSGLTGSDEQLETIRRDLAADLRRNLRRDQEGLKTKKFHPHGWAPNVYRDYIDNNEYWYNSTLLVACLGPREAFALWAGDGGIRILKAGREETTALESTDDLAVGTFVSLQVTSAHFRIARISYPPRSGRIEVYLASDGVDRTLQRASLPYRDLGAPKDPREARELLHRLARRPQRELDNYSLAWLSGPPPNSFRWKPVPQLPGPQLPVPQLPAPGKAPSLWSIKVNRPPAPSESSTPPEPSTKTPAEPEPPVPVPPPPPLARRWRSPVLLTVGFAFGFITALGLPRVPSQVNEENPNISPLDLDPDPGRPPAPSPLKSADVPAPASIVIGEEDRGAMNAGQLSPAMRAGLEPWVQFLEQQPADRKYYVVVFGMRNRMADPFDCIKNLNRAEKRSRLLSNGLATALSAAAQKRLDPTGRANVCTPPAGLNDLLSADAVRAVLTEAPPTCKCDQPPKGLPKKKPPEVEPAPHSEEQKAKEVKAP